MATRPLIFLVDQDGPLAGFDPHFFERCAEEGWPMDCDLTTQTARFATEHIPNEEHRSLARSMVDTAGWFLDLPLVEGAAEGITKLAEVPNSEVWICTKPLEANATCRDDKAAWVEKHLGDEWVDRLILAPDKSLVHGDLLLDDAPKLEWMTRATWVPVVYPMSWNQTGSDWEGMHTWSWGDDLEELVDLAIYNDRYSGLHHANWGY